MKHRVKHNQLGRNTNQMKALRRGLVLSVFEKGKVETTLPKAKAIVPEVDRILVLAKTDSVHSRREVAKILGTDKDLDQIFKVVAPKTNGRTSGFARIIKLGPRFSDNTEMAIIELIDYQPEPVVAKEKAEVKKEEAKQVEAPKTEKVKPTKVAKAKPQTTQKPKAIGHK